MKRAVNYFLVSCVVAAWILVPASLASKSAEAATSLALVSGTVKDDLGKPLAGAVVALFTAQPGQIIGGSLLKSVSTDAEGRFTANVAPGMYRLRAVADGFRPTFTLITLDTANKITHNFSLRRVGTLVEKRGDKADYRWIGRSVPRTILHYDDEEENTSNITDVAENKPAAELTIHGVLQLTYLKNGEAAFAGANFAISSTVSENLEVALLGQEGIGQAAPQRISAIASFRPSSAHQVTTIAGYGQTLLRRNQKNQTLNQFSFAALDTWQVNRPLLLIYGFDYSSFGNFGKGQDSILPRIAVQYTPSARTHLNAALTPGNGILGQAQEGLDSESIHAKFDTQQPEVALNNNTAISDRSRRFELGFERILGESEDSSIEATAFYDMISGHGVGILALPLEASPENQNAFQQVVHQVMAMNGAARGIRLMYSKRLNDYLTASVGYSLGRGERFNESSLDKITPAQIFTGGNFQVASAKLDLDFSHRTGTRVSTVVRLSPSAVVFAIDPFAGRMSVYDPNVSIYVTQSLPTFGLPVKAQALVDLRNLLNQTTGVDNDKTQLIAARSQRSVRGAISFQW